MQEILDFIKHFKGAEGTFLHGCCYWFAWILKERFDNRGWIVTIYHDPVIGHFIAQFIPEYLDECEFNEKEIKYFDVRGDVTNEYLNTDYLESMYIMETQEERRWGRLMCDCKYFIDPEDSRYPKYLEN